MCVCVPMAGGSSLAGLKVLRAHQQRQEKIRAVSVRPLTRWPAAATQKKKKTTNAENKHISVFGDSFNLHIHVLYILNLDT